MSTKRRYGEKKRNGILRYLYYSLFGLILIWLVASIVFKSNPIDLLGSSFSKIGNSVSDALPELPEDNVAVDKDSIIAQLKNDLSICRGEKDYQKALVVINSDHLNLRSSASLSSEIVFQIPAGSVVDIMYYDTQTFFLDGEQGKWAKIVYAEQEGWAWGNYLQKIGEEDPALDNQE